MVGMCRRRGAAGSSVEELALLSIRVLVGCSATGPAARALVKGMLPVRVRVTSTRVVVTGGHSLARFLQDASLGPRRGGSQCSQSRTPPAHRHDRDRHMATRGAPVRREGVYAGEGGAVEH